MGIAKNWGISDSVLGPPFPTSKQRSIERCFVVGNGGPKTLSEIPQLMANPIYRIPLLELGIRLK